MTWKFQPAKPSFEDAQEDWDSINRAGNNHILLDSGFVAPLLRHFANGNVTLAVRDDSARKGMALLVRKRLAQWETFQPAQAPIGLFLLERPDSTGQELLEIARKLPGHALQLSILQQDPDYTSATVEQSQHRFEHLEYIRTARITLSGTFEEYWQKRGTNLRHNVNRRRKRATERGLTSKLIVRRSPEEVAEAIREYGRLESSGWKGRDGTAVAPENAQGRFYREVFEHFCARGEGLIYQFLLGDKVAASDLCLQRDGMMIVLKTAYDEALSEFSPAFLMREDALRQLYSEGRVRVIEFYGRVMEWHTRWTEEIRAMYHINYFRYGWVQSLKNFRKPSA
jgi:CelD/BcsL family acetyltransferase involved in cellulose biosynthesis